MLVDLRLQIEELKASNLQHTSDIEDLRLPDHTTDNRLISLERRMLLAEDVNRRSLEAKSNTQIVLGPVVANLVKGMAKLVGLITTSKLNSHNTSSWLISFHSTGLKAKNWSGHCRVR